MSAPAPTHRPPALFMGLLAIALALALVPTVWPGWDLQVAHYFADTPEGQSARSWWWVQGINRYVPALFRGMLLASLLGGVWLRLRRSSKPLGATLIFVALAGALGPGLVVNMGLKDHWQRARPYQVVEFGGTQQFTRAAVIANQCDNNCSFVSGHVSCGFFFASLMLVHRRRARAWVCMGTMLGLCIGFARMADQAHWLSDVLWAYPVTLASTWALWAARQALQRRTDH